MSCWLSGSQAIFFERRPAAIGALGDRLITPSAFYEVLTSSDLSASSHPWVGTNGTP